MERLWRGKVENTDGTVVTSHAFFLQEIQVVSLSGVSR